MTYGLTLEQWFQQDLERRTLGRATEPLYLREDAAAMGEMMSLCDSTTRLNYHQYKSRTQDGGDPFINSRTATNRIHAYINGLTLIGSWFLHLGHTRREVWPHKRKAHVSYGQYSRAKLCQESYHIKENTKPTTKTDFDKYFSCLNINPGHYECVYSLLFFSGHLIISSPWGKQGDTPMTLFICHIDEIDVS